MECTLLSSICRQDAAGSLQAVAGAGPNITVAMFGDGQCRPGDGATGFKFNADIKRELGAAGMSHAIQLTATANAAEKAILPTTTWRPHQCLL